MDEIGFPPLEIAKNTDLSSSLKESTSRFSENICVPVTQAVDLENRDIEHLNDLKDESYIGIPNTPSEPHEVIRSALRSVYDYTNRIKSFVEQDYAFTSDGSQEKLNNESDDDHDSPEKIVQDLINFMLDAVCERVQVRNGRDQKVVSTVESPPLSYLAITISMMTNKEEEIGLYDSDTVPEPSLNENDITVISTEEENNIECLKQGISLNAALKASDSSDSLELKGGGKHPDLENAEVINELDVKSRHTDSESPAKVEEGKKFTRPEHSEFEDKTSDEANAPAEQNPSLSDNLDHRNLREGKMDSEMKSQDENSELEANTNLNNGDVFPPENDVRTTQPMNNLRENIKRKPSKVEQMYEEHRKTFSSESFMDTNDLWETFPPIENSKLTNVEEMDPDTVCGIGIFKPRWLQRWATSKTFLVFFSIVGVLQGSYYTYLIGIMTTLEKRYAFESKVSGTVMMVDEITPLFFGVLIGYFGGKTHRPRVVAFGMFISALCCFISSLPYFMYGSSKHLALDPLKNTTDTSYCDRNNHRVNHCGVDDRPPTMTAVTCLLIGSFMKGFGSLAYYAVGMSYMDDTTKKTNTPIYLGEYSLRECMRKEKISVNTRKILFWR